MPGLSSLTHTPERWQMPRRTARHAVVEDEHEPELVQRQEYLDTTIAKNIPNIFNLIGRRSKRL